MYIKYTFGDLSLSCTCSRILNADHIGVVGPHALKQLLHRDLVLAEDLAVLSQLHHHRLCRLG